MPASVASLIAWGGLDERYMAAVTEVDFEDDQAPAVRGPMEGRAVGTVSMTVGGQGSLFAIHPIAQDEVVVSNEGDSSAVG